MFWTIVAAVIVGIWIYSNLHILENIIIFFIGLLAACFAWILKNIKVILAIIFVLSIFFMYQNEKQKEIEPLKTNYTQQVPTLTPTPSKPKVQISKPPTAEEFYEEVVKQRGW